jgi:hypothetical protein
MPQLIINIGTEPDTGDGDTVRVAFDKVNQNFTELYNTVDDLTDEIIEKDVLEKDIVGSVYAADGSTVIVDSNNSNIKAADLEISGTVDGDLIPSIDSEFTIGTPEKQWKALYLTGNTIFIDGVPVGVNANGDLIVNGTTILSLDNWETLIRQEIINQINQEINIDEIDGGTY